MKHSSDSIVWIRKYVYQINKSYPRSLLLAKPKDTFVRKPICIVIRKAAPTIVYTVS